MLLNIVTGVFNRKKVEMRKQVYIYSVWHTHGEFPDATYAYCAYHFAEELPKMRVIEDWDEKPTDEYPCSLCKPCTCGCWHCK